MNESLKIKENEINDLRSENRKLVQYIEDLFYMLREELLITKDELSDLLELLEKYKT